MTTLVTEGDEWKAVGSFLAEQQASAEQVREADREGGREGGGETLLELSPFKDTTRERAVESSSFVGQHNDDDDDSGGEGRGDRFEALHLHDPFAPSEAGPSGSCPCGSPEVLAYPSGKVRKTLATFLYRQLAEGLCGKAPDIPRCLQLHDVLYLAYRITPDEEKGDKNSLQRVFEVFDKHLRGVVGRVEENTQVSLASNMGSVHGAQCSVLVQAHLAFVAEGAVKEYFTGKISDMFSGPRSGGDLASHANASTTESLMKCAEKISECSTAYAAYTGCFLREVEGREADRHKNVILSTFFEPLRWALQKKMNDAWHSQLQSLLSEVHAILEEAVTSLAETWFGPGEIARRGEGEVAKEILTCRWESKIFNLTAARAVVVSKPLSRILDALAHLWEKRNGQDLCVDYTLIATCFEIVSATLTYVENMSETESASHTFNFRSHMITLRFISAIKTIVEYLRRNIEAYDLSMGDFDLPNQALTLCCKARDLERAMSDRLCMRMERYSMRFFVTPLQNAQGAWKSEKSPDEELQPILVGFAFFCMNLLSQAREMQLQTDVQDSIGKILLHVLCNKIVGEIYRNVSPSAKRRFRFLCDVAFLTEIGRMLETALGTETRKKDHVSNKDDLESVLGLSTSSFKSLQKHAILSCCTLDTLNRIFERQSDPCPKPVCPACHEENLNASTMISRSFSGKWRDVVESSNEFTRKLKGTVDKESANCIVSELDQSGVLPWLNQEYNCMQISTSDIHSSLQARLQDFEQEREKEEAGEGDVRGKISALNSHIGRLSHL